MKSNFKKRTSKTYPSYFKYADIFGVPIELYFHGSRRYRSYSSALISTFIIAFSLYLLCLQLIGWNNIDNSTTIYSTENFSVTSLLTENRSIEYTLNSENYNIYFAVWATLPNGNELNYIDLAKYFQIQYKYSPTGDEVNAVNIESESCNTLTQNNFLGLAYNDSIKPNDVNEFQMCIKSPFKMGLMGDLASQSVFSPSILFEISKCSNETAIKKYSCASDEEIQQIIKYVHVQASIPKTIFDFKNKTFPIKRIYKYEDYSLDLNLIKRMANEIDPTFLYKDCGYLFDNYILDSLNFNPNQPTININTKDSDSNVLFQYDITSSYQIEKLYVKNQKLNEMLGSYGGMINLLYTICNFICYYINSYFLSKSLLKIAFQLDGQPKSKKSLTVLNKKITPDVKLFIAAKNTLLKKISKKFLYEYVDLKKIINRLQDVDKLKSILFNESQKFFFDMIPKPQLGDQNDVNSKFKANHVRKFKLKTSHDKTILEHYQKLHENSSYIDQKIVSLIDDATKYKINVHAKKIVLKNRKLEFRKPLNMIINENELNMKGKNGLLIYKM